MRLASSVPSEKPASRVGVRLRIAFLTGIVALIIGAYALSRPLHDFLEYWTVSHLLVMHINPYSLPVVFQEQVKLGWSEPVPLMFLSPPWALPLLLPVAFASSYTLAWLAWAVMVTAALALSSRILMDVYFRDLRIAEISDTAFHRCLFAFTFYPVLLCLKYTQTTPLILLGVAGFLFWHNRRPLLAGAWLSLTMIKPQLLYLVWLALLVRSWQERQGKILASAGIVLAVLSATALAFDHQAFAHYRELMSGPYLGIFPSGAMGLFRRALRGRETFWMQFVFPILGIGWFASYWRRYRHGWNWSERMPALVNASILSTAYGWIYDQTLLAVPIIALAAAHAREEGRISGNAVILYTALNCVLMLLMALPAWSFLPAPLLLLVLLFRQVRNLAPSPEITVSA